MKTNLNQRLFIIIFSTLLLLTPLAYNCNALEVSSGRPASFWDPPLGYPTFIFDDKGLFVEIPAAIGVDIFSFAGFPVTATFGTMYYLSKGKLLLPDEQLLWSIETFGRAGDFTFGLPFFAIKKSFWDGPIYLWDSAFGTRELSEETNIIKPVKQKIEVERLVYNDARYIIKRVNGMVHGRYSKFYPNGQLWERGQYENGKRSGNWTFFHPNGNVEKCGRYEKGLFTGKWTFWNKKGLVTREEVFEPVFVDEK